jgi:hypothetical protein
MKLTIRNLSKHAIGSRIRLDSAQHENRVYRIGLEKTGVPGCRLIDNESGKSFNCLDIVSATDFYIVD